MSENWAAVAHAINQRVAELGLRQRELAERSHVSQAIVRELMRNTVNRRRSARTLEALSLALDWHPDHLSAVLASRTPPDAGEPVPGSDDDVAARLAIIERHLRQINHRLDEMNSRLAAVSADHDRAGG